MRTKKDVTFSVFPNSIERNPYTNIEEGQGSIYSARVKVTINYDNYYFTIVSGYRYSINIDGYYEMTEYKLKDFNQAFKDLNKIVSKASLDYSYLNYERRYQIQLFWNLLKELDFTLSYDNFKPVMESFKKIEDRTRDHAIAIRMEKEKHEKNKELSLVA